jgi:L-lactate dehydrogenase complex protein LldG
MTGREKILARIREALSVRAPFPGSHGDHAPAAHAGPRPVRLAQQWLPPGGQNFEQRVERFAAASADLKTDFRRLGSWEEASEALRQMARDEGWRRIATHSSDPTDTAAAALATSGIAVLRTDGGYDRDALEACDAGITGCDVLVAQTGSLIVNSRAHGGRALSVLPPHHVVLARGAQLVSDLAEAFHHAARSLGPEWPSMISLVTGPSRTGDIERILVLGAHGPKKLTVLMW